MGPTMSFGLNLIIFSKMIFLKKKILKMKYKGILGPQSEDFSNSKILKTLFH